MTQFNKALNYVLINKNRQKIYLKFHLNFTIQTKKK